MSKSFKKYPAAKSGGYVTKTEANKAFRRRNKQLLLEDEETIFFKQDEIINPCNIVDYRFIDFKNRKENMKYKRK